MADPFIAEIRVFGFNFAPKGWAECNGQLMPISQNTALFALLGINFGGDGKVTFGLPNFQGAAAVGQGQGSGLAGYNVGDNGGAPTVTLIQSEIPAHTHQAKSTNEFAEYQAPAPNRSLARSKPKFAWQSDASSNLVLMNYQSTTVVGSSAPHNNMPPSMPLVFCIALQGVWPERE
jgi:microcystin-dependent protein